MNTIHRTGHLYFSTESNFFLSSVNWISESTMFFTVTNIPRYQCFLGHLPQSAIPLLHPIIHLSSLKSYNIDHLFVHHLLIFKLILSISFSKGFHSSEGSFSTKFFHSLMRLLQLLLASPLFSEVLLMFTHVFCFSSLFPYISPIACPSFFADPILLNLDFTWSSLLWHIDLLINWGQS